MLQIVYKHQRVRDARISCPDAECAASACLASGRASGSFSRAADALSYTQSAVSQAIATLEAEAGATLIERDRRGVRPTAVGAALVAHADVILADLEAAETELAAIVGGHGGHLRMASFRPPGPPSCPWPSRDSPPPSAGRLEPRGGRAGGDRPPPARRRVRPRAAVRVPDAGERLDAGLRRLDLLEDPMHVALPPAIRSPTSRACAWRTCGRSRGCRPRRPARARATSYARATARASSPLCPSRATTTRPSRASSPRAWALR